VFEVVKLGWGEFLANFGPEVGELGNIQREGILAIDKYVDAVGVLDLRLDGSDLV